MPTSHAIWLHLRPGTGQRKSESTNRLTATKVPFLCMNKLLSSLLGSRTQSSHLPVIRDDANLAATAGSSMHDASLNGGGAHQSHAALWVAMAWTTCERASQHERT
eukprot:3272814-Pleurochrysis_carterae.AAC.4